MTSGNTSISAYQVYSGLFFGLPLNSDFFQQIFPVGGSILQEAMQSLGLLVLR